MLSFCVLMKWIDLKLFLNNSIWIGAKIVSYFCALFTKLNFSLQSFKIILKMLIINIKQFFAKMFFKSQNFYYFQYKRPSARQRSSAADGGSGVGTNPRRLSSTLHHSRFRFAKEPSASALFENAKLRAENGWKIHEFWNVWNILEFFSYFYVNFVLLLML